MKKLFLVVAFAILSIIANAQSTSENDTIKLVFGSNIEETKDLLVARGYSFNGKEDDGTYIFSTDGVEYILYLSEGKQVYTEFHYPESDHWSKILKLWQEIKEELINNCEIVYIVEKFDCGSINAYAGEMGAIHAGKCKYYGQFKCNGSKVSLHISETGMIMVKYEEQ